MTECDFCGEDFDSDRELHLHWGEKHEDELNSHQQEKVKKAERKEENEKEVKSSRRRSLLLKGLTGVTLIIFVTLVLPQIMAMFQSSPFQLDRQPMLGDENASVTVVEFGDYQCPHCKDFENQVKPQLNEEYIETGQVKFYYINLPVIDQKSNLAATASEYVYGNEPESYWDFHSALFDIRASLTRPTVIEAVTQNTNITEQEIEEGLNQERYNDEVQADQKIANGNGVTGTPIVYVNGERVESDYQSIKNAIEKRLPDEQ
jgi:protein-disulfide isomerase